MLISENDIIPKDAFHTFEKIFERTELINGGRCSYSKIVEHVEKLQGKNNSVPVICNTKNEAAQMYRTFRKDQKNCVHLSASMCMAHRKRVLRKLFELLHSGEKIICVSTQVIDTGVDISFNAVVRFSAGMDEIIQSAGRCNRNGEIEGRAPVYIVECEDEHLGLMKEMKAGQDATKELLYRFSRNPMEYDADLSSKKSIDYYYNVLYRILKNEIGENYFDYSVEEGGSVLTLLSQNELFRTGDDEYVMHQAFKTAGDQFTVFGDDEVSVVVPYGEGEAVIDDLLSERAGKDTAFLQRLIRNAKEYTVSVYSNQLRALFRQGAIKSICDGTVNILSKNWYDLDLGVQLEPIKEEDSECSILIL